MRGIILAGGTGSRLGPLTRAVNKHLLPVGGVPMIDWPIETLRALGVELDNITIVSSPDGIGQIARYLGEGYTYRVQDKPGGIVQALDCAGRGSKKENIAVILGDNIFLPPPRLLEEKHRPMACVFLKEVPAGRLCEFGVPTFNEFSEIEYVTEKPVAPASKYAVTGLYELWSDVFDCIANIKPSARGECEITDLLNLYARDKLLDYVVCKEGFWGDAGTLAGMAECSVATQVWK